MSFGGSVGSLLLLVGGVVGLEVFSLAGLDKAEEVGGLVGLLISSFILSVSSLLWMISPVLVSMRLPVSSSIFTLSFFSPVLASMMLPDSST